MCGRFVGFRKLEELKTYFPIDKTLSGVMANFNVAPSQKVLVLVRRDQKNVLDRFHWGLVPFWAKDTSIGYKMINARSETVNTKPSFRAAFQKRRCLILADGFYEWVGVKGSKQPVYITLADQRPFAFAGLWEIWQPPGGKPQPYQSCAIITREAKGAIRKVHHRMPVIMSPNTYDSWLDPQNRDTKALQSILTHQALTDLVFHPVDKQVNSTRSNVPSNIFPVQAEFDFK